ncbi:MAG: hypothetical protein V4505_01095 [Pseudomonadota bacterium]
MHSLPRLRLAFLALCGVLVLAAGAAGWLLVEPDRACSPGACAFSWHAVSRRCIGALATAGMAALALESLWRLGTALWWLAARRCLRVFFRRLGRRGRRRR